MARTSASTKRRLLGVVFAAAATAAASQGHALTIVPYFDASITGASNAVQIEDRINSALSFYSGFSNAATVNIVYRLGATDLGSSESTLYGAFSRSSYVAALQADAAANPGNAVLQTALNNILSGNQLSIFAPSANLRALGFSQFVGAYGADGSFGAGGTFDGIVTLSDTPDKIAFGDSVPDGSYGANQVIQHETDEVLGVGGSGTLLGSNLSGQGMGVEDLYRYGGDHVGSYTTSPSANAYFSIDGGHTDIIDFNQTGDGDYGDWVKTTCGGAQHVQDFAGCPEPAVGQFGLTLGSPEVIAMQAIGYNLEGVVPEPAAWALMIAGLGMTGAALRRRRAPAAA